MATLLTLLLFPTHILLTYSGCTNIFDTCVSDAVNGKNCLLAYLNLLIDGGYNVVHFRRFFFLTDVLLTPVSRVNHDISRESRE